MRVESLRSAVRVDSWLWAVRIFPTRSAATAACRSGHVRVGGDRAKAARPVGCGDEVRVRISGFDRVLIVRTLVAKRVGAAVAQVAYSDLSEPRPTRSEAPLPAMRDRGAGRPTKRDRRDIERLLRR